MILLKYFPANSAYAFIHGEGPIRNWSMLRMGDEPMFFRNRNAAVKAAHARGLSVDRKGRVSSSRQRSGMGAIDPSDLDDFTRQYIETALWSSNDESDERGGEPLDANYSIEDFDPASLKKMVRDAQKFQRENKRDLSVNVDEEQGGHDFWLTRNGHGAGFWDGDWPEPQASRLTKAAQRYGEVYIYVGDDKKLHVD